MDLDPSKFPGFSKGFTPEGASTVYTPPTPEPGIPGVVARAAVGATVPTAGAIAGAEAGAAGGGAVGTAILPGIGTAVGGIGGGLIGAIGGGYAAARGQQAVFDAAPRVAEALGQSPEQQAADEAAHPYARMAGELIPQAVALNPTNLLAKGLSTSERIAAAGGAAIGAGIQGGQEAFNEYRDTGAIDPAKVGMQSAAGAVFSGHARFGLGDIVSGRTDAAAAAGSAPLSDNAPSDLLQLSDQRGAEPVNVPAPLALPSPEMVAGPRQGPSAQLTSFSEGLHPDAVARNNPSPVTDFTAPDLGVSSGPSSVLDTLEAPSPFTVGDIFNKIGTDLEGGAVKGRDKPYALQISSKLADSLRGGDVDGARAFLADQVESLQASDLQKGTIDKRAAVLAAAHDVIDDFYTKPPEPAAPEAAPGSLRDRIQATEAPPADAPPAPEPAPAAPAMSLDEANARGQASIQKTSADLATAHREGLLDGILSDPETRNPTGRFIAELRRNGYDRTLTEAEAAKLAGHEDARAQAPAAAPARAEGKAPVDDRVEFAGPDESDNFGIRERGAPRKPSDAPLQARAPQRPFEMTPYSQADIARKEAAETRRANKGQGEEPTAGEPSAELFDDQGGPSMDVRRGQAIAAADRALAEAKGKAARDVVQQAHDMMVAGHAEPELVGHVADMTRQGKLAAAKQLLATITNKPEEGPPVTRTADQVQNLRQAALDHIEGSEMGSTKTQHFLHGVDAELGLSSKARPEGSTRQAAYDAGRTFVRDYKEPVADPAATTRQNIRDAVDAGTLKNKAAQALEVKLDQGEDPAKVQELLDRVSPTAMRARASADRTAEAPPADRLLAAKDRLRDELTRLGLADVKLNVDPALEGMAGSYTFNVRDGDLITVALKSDTPEGMRKAVATLGHEAIHAMRNMNLFSPEEWRTLENAAMGDFGATMFAEVNYPELSEEQRLEEAVAEMFGRWYAKQLDKGAKSPTVINRLLARIQAVIEAVGRALRGQGFRDAEEVMRAVLSGDIGTRGGFPLSEMAEAAAKARKLGLGEVHDSAADATSNAMDGLRKFSLNFLAVRQFKHYFPALRQPLEHFWEALSQAGAARSDRQFRSAQVVDALNKLPAEERAAVGTLGLDATAAKLDPLTPGNEMADRLDAMSPHAQAAYRAAREDLARQLQDYKDVKKAIIEQSTDLSPADKKAAMAAVDGEGLGVYWPMKRFGDLVAISKSAEYTAAEGAFDEARAAYNGAIKAGADEKTLVDLRGKLGDAREAMQSIEGGKVVAAFEKRSELTKHVKAMQDQGYDVTTTTKPKGASSGGQDNVELAAVNRALDKQIADAQADADKATGDAKKSAQRTIEALEGMKSMMAEVHATFSREGSALRAGMRRKGVAGFSEDGVRSYALASQQNAGFVTAMEFGSKARTALADLHAAALKTGDYRQMQVYDQLKGHYDQLGKYANSPISRILTNGAYAYNLAASPSFMAMHLMQTPLVTAPVMGARFGLGKSIAELGRAAGEVVAARGKGHVTPESLGQDQGEVEMLKFLERHGTVSTSDAAALQDAADPKGAIGKASEKIMAVASYLPHHTERFNRLATALADYRLALKDKNLTGLVSDEQLAKAQGEGWQGSKEQLAAAIHAQETTLDTHVDYGKDNAAAYMQGFDRFGISKLMFQFQKYQQAMIEFEVRSVKDALDKSLPTEERLVALRTLLGIVGSHAIMTGAMGLPGFGAAAFLMDAYHKLLGSPDKVFDAETSFRRFMNEHFGLDVGNVISRGVLYAPGLRDALPADVTDRLGMGDLLVPADRLDGVDRQDLVQYIGAAVGGPAGGMLGNFVHGFNLMRQGKTERGLEQFLPKAARDIAKTARYMNEGVETESGTPVVAQGDLTPADLAAQAAGFTPQKVATAQANKEAIDSAKASMKTRRGILTQTYEHSVTGGDADRAAQALQDIQAYNQERLSEGLANQVIKPTDLSSAVRQHMMEHILLSQGVALNPRDRMLTEEGIVGS